MQNEVTINGTVYVPKSSVKEKAPNFKGLKYVIIRTYSAGVHSGYLKSRNGNEVVLLKSRRLWKWAGAFTLSELSRFGSKKMTDCKFACEVDEIEILGVIEVIPCTKEAFESITNTPVYEC